MKLNIDIELSDKEIEYIKYINDIADEFGIFNLDNYTLSKQDFKDIHLYLQSKSIITYHHEHEYYYTTYIFDEIFKQLPK